MFERYHYVHDLDDDQEGYLLFDRQRGSGDTYDPYVHKIACVYDVDMAERIVRLLNADAKLVERQGGKVA